MTASSQRDESRGRWARLESLFREALDLPPGDRSRFLEDLPMSDAELRTELADLLDAHEDLSAADARHPVRDGRFLSRLDAVRAAALVGETPSGAPETIGPFRLDGFLGEGGMGVVYRAHDPRLQRDVAVKLLPRWLADDASARARFSQEARAASGLDHPNIATIYEIGVAADGRPYIAMACYPGRTLAQRMEDGPLPVEKAVEIARGMVRGLVAAHRAGVVHRDVKPANVALTDAGTVKLLDFGVAQVAGNPLTRAGSAPGTVAYMSPEQTRGEKVDQRTDLWSVGVVLYELLAGRRPFSARESDALVYQVRHDPAAPLRDLRPEVPEWLAAMVARCLEKDPDARPSSAEELLSGLEGEAGGMAPSPVKRGGARAVHRRGGAAWIAAGMVGVAVSWVLVGQGGRRTGSPGGPVDAERTVAVLPFESLDDGEEAATYARGIHDDLVTQLSAAAGLRVTSRRAVQGLTGDERSIAEVAEALDVRWVLEGSVGTSGGELRVNARLVDPRTESQTWARGYRRSLSGESLQELPAAIATEAALSLDARLSVMESPGARSTLDLAAYRAYVEGRTNLERRTEAGLLRGAEAFRKALAQAPDHAPSWAGLTEASVLLASYGYEPRDSVLPEARDAVERALALDPELAEAHAARGLLLMEAQADGPGALGAFRRALSLEPSNAQAAQWLGGVLINLGRLEEARVPLERAVELDPTSPAMRAALARWFQYADSLETALEQARVAARLAPSSPQVQLVLGEILRGLGRSGEALVVLERARALPGANPLGFPGLWVELALAYEDAGDVERADELLVEIDDRTPPMVRAAAESGRGNVEASLELLARSPVLPGHAHVLRYHQVFDPLRPEPAFLRLLTRYDRAWGIGGGPEASP